MTIIHDWDLSQEVVHAVFVKIWESREQLSIQSSVKSYLFQAVKNRSIDTLRKMGSENKLKEEVLSRTKEDHQETIIEDEQIILRHLIKQAVQQLKPRMKQIFELHKFEGLTYQEIADYLQISKRTVEDNMARALKILYNQLKSKME